MVRLHIKKNISAIRLPIILVYLKGSSERFECNGARFDGSRRQSDKTENTRSYKKKLRAHGSREI